MTRCFARAASGSGSRRCARRTSASSSPRRSSRTSRTSTIAPAIIESCASRIFSPNPQATELQIRTIYEGFGLNSRQIEIVATAQPKRDYYYQSRLGNRLFDLDLGPAALAFAGASTPQDQRDIDRVLTPRPALPASPVRGCAIAASIWAADLLPSFPGGALRFFAPNPWRFRHEDRALLLSVSLAAVLSVLAAARAARVGPDGVRPVRTSCRTR